MNFLRPKAESQVAYDPEKTDDVAPARYDAFALPILVAYVVFMPPVLVLRLSLCRYGPDSEGCFVCISVP
jgi:hypothetical protein